MISETIYPNHAAVIERFGTRLNPAQIEELSASMAVFRLLLTTAAIDRNSVILAWEQYRTMCTEFGGLGITSSDKSTVHADAVLYELRHNHAVDGTLASAARFVLEMYTTGRTIPGNTGPGFLLQGLAPDELVSALHFCDAMNDIAGEPHEYGPRTDMQVTAESSTH